MRFLLVGHVVILKFTCLRQVRVIIVNLYAKNATHQNLRLNIFHCIVVLLFSYFTHSFLHLRTFLSVKNESISENFGRGQSSKFHIQNITLVWNKFVNIAFIKQFKRLTVFIHFKANMKSYKPLETAAIFFCEPISKTGY